MTFEARAKSAKLLGLGGIEMKMCARVAFGFLVVIVAPAWADGIDDNFMSREYNKSGPGVIDDNFVSRPYNQRCPGDIQNNFIQDMSRRQNSPEQDDQIQRNDSRLYRPILPEDGNDQQ